VGVYVSGGRKRECGAKEKTDQPFANWVCRAGGQKAVGSKTEQEDIYRRCLNQKRGQEPTGFFSEEGRDKKKNEEGIKKMGREMFQKLGG